jgi:hypothetical protein
MYPEAAIKTSFHKVCDHRVKISNMVSFAFDRHRGAK